MAQQVKNLSAVEETQEMWVPRLGRFPGEGMATHSSILAWRIPCQRSLVGCSPQGHKESDMNKVTEHAHACTPKILTVLFYLETT